MQTLYFVYILICGCAHLRLLQRLSRRLRNSVATVVTTRVLSPPSGRSLGCLSFQLSRRPSSSETGQLEASPRNSPPPYSNRLSHTGQGPPFLRRMRSEEAVSLEVRSPPAGLHAVALDLERSESSWAWVLHLSPGAALHRRCRLGGSLTASFQPLID